MARESRTSELRESTAERACHQNLAQQAAEMDRNRWLEALPLFSI